MTRIKAFVYDAPVLWKVMLAPLIAALVFALYMAQFYLSARSSSGALENTRETQFPQLLLATENAHLLDRVSETLNAAAAAGEKEGIEAADQVAKKLRGNYVRIGELGPGEADEMKAMVADFDAYYKLARGLAESMLASKAPDASAAKDMGARLQALRKRMDKYAEGARSGFRANLEGVTDSLQRSLWIGLLLGVGVFILLLPGLVYWVARVLVARPMAEAVLAARAIAEGDLRRAVPTGSRDEAGQLLAAIGTVKERLDVFCAAQTEMSRRHEAGETAATIDASSLQGAYRDMAEGVNALAAGHIQVMGEAISIVSEYAQGNLVRDLADLPGERAKITAAMKTVKANLTAINGEILKLTTAAAKGDFSARGNEGRFDHDFKKMIAGLNGLMEVADQGLSDVAKTLAAIAKGDLTARIHADYEGTFGELKDNSNETASQLGQIVAQIRKSADSINTASGEMAQGNADLSQRTEVQATSLEKTATSMEELTSTVKQNAENAKQANQLAVSASGVATQGGQVVSQVVETMSAISESAKKIADIITVIDGIAFQTNILALNAAVEAARAGEQGRGFAVVAGEVRTLAQRSAEAAKQIKDLIGDSVEKVETGSKLVDDAGKTMDEVVTSVKRVADIISEITAASLEQSSGIEQVNQAITQMDQVTQQNAALVEQAAAAAQSMREQATGLAQAVSVFRVDAQPRQAAIPALPAPR